MKKKTKKKTVKKEVSIESFIEQFTETLKNKYEIKVCMMALIRKDMNSIHFRDGDIIERMGLVGLCSKHIMDQMKSIEI